jgi:hypothetical protein
MSNTTRNDVKQLAERIEALAKEVQSKLDANGDFLTPANELTRNNLTFVFTLGEYYANQQNGGTVKATTVSNPNGTQVRYHNVRDSRGRFAPKV